jgi:flagellum-specific ATP synthase
MDRLNPYRNILHGLDPVRHSGKVTQLIGLTVEADGPEANIGDVCEIFPGRGRPSVLAEVVGFRQQRVILMPLGVLDAIGPGCEVVSKGHPLQVAVGQNLLGQVLDGLGRPMNGTQLSSAMISYPADNLPPNPLTRQRVKDSIQVGVRVIDSLLSVGKGQRVGIFAGSGVGKSTLLGMIARNTSADVNVIALIGERGREVLDFIERDLGPEGLARSVVVVATSDQPALVRMKASLIATAIAEYFRDQGLDVMLMMDSVTRYAMALREVGLAVGEPPATRGYTPSVFAALPRLLERAGTSAKGTITAFYTVLVDGDDMNDPIADAVRGILDGHMVLDRKIAQKGHFPAVDVLQSISRVMREIVSPEHQQAADRVRRWMAVYRDAEDLINIGMYQRGSNVSIDEAVERWPVIESFTRQSVEELSEASESTTRLLEISMGG